MNLKKLAAIVIILCLGIVGWAIYKNKKSESEQSSENDYEIIETLHNELEKISKSSSISSVGDNATWYIFELGLMYEKEGDFFKELSKALGDDFKWKLSNGDSLFVGILPYRKSYRIYAGEPDEDHMLYPEWNYSELEEK
jgi:hypothetical protein rflaF_14202